MKKVFDWWLPDSDKHIAEKLEEQSPVNRGFDYQTQQRDYALAFSLKYASRSKVALDIGAHVGLWAVDMANHFKELICFEPIKESRECLIKNMADRNITNYRIHKCALGSKSGTVKLNTNDDNSGNPFIDKNGDEEAQMKTLDMFGFAKIDLIKIDVEGFELEVLKGGEHTIKMCKPIIVLETKDKHYERYGTNFREILSWLEARNYKVENLINSEAIFVDKNLPTRTYFASKDDN
tara:strand:+ start:121 stop:828 length:708 start_codon:yes stop_codon:yes gene_type:complete